MNKAAAKLTCKVYRSARKINKFLEIHMSIPTVVSFPTIGIQVKCAPRPVFALCGLDVATLVDFGRYSES